MVRHGLMHVQLWTVGEQSSLRCLLDNAMKDNGVLAWLVALSACSLDLPMLL
jgi:hypothetical protein